MKFVRHGFQELEPEQYTQTCFLLLWPWPWLYDLDIWINVVIRSVPKMKFLGQGFQQLETKPGRTDRQTDR